MEERVHEVTSRQLFDFLSFPGKQFQEQCGRKTTNHRGKKAVCRLMVTELLPLLEIAVDGKRVSDCAVLVADTYHIPDPSTHPSPSAPHNSRNTFKKSVSQERRGCEINAVRALPPFSAQLSFALTDKQ